MVIQYVLLCGGGNPPSYFVSPSNDATARREKRGRKEGKYPYSRPIISGTSQNSSKKKGGEGFEGERIAILPCQTYEKEKGKEKGIRTVANL